MRIERVASVAARPTTPYWQPRSICTWLILRGSGAQLCRYGIAACAVLLILLVGVSLVYLEAHYATDVIAGFVAGLIWTDMVIIGSRFLKSRRKWEVGSSSRRTSDGILRPASP